MDNYIIDDIKNIFSKRIRELRTTNNLTIREIAKKLGIAFASYRQYETKRALPKYDILIKIAKYYDVSTDFLLGLNNQSL